MEVMVETTGLFSKVSIVQIGSTVTLKVFCKVCVGVAVSLQAL